MTLGKKHNLKRRLRTALYVSFSVVLLAVGLGLFAIHYRPAPMEIVCAGGAAEMGRTYGNGLSLPMKLLMRLYIQGGVCGGDEGLIESRHRRASALVGTLTEPYKTELRAVSEAAGCDLNALAYANCFLDMGNARSGCRSVVALTDERLFHSHNLDWNNLAGLAKWTTTIVRRHPNDDRLATVTICYPGMLGALDTINERGIALSFNQLGWGKGVPVEPIFVSMRRIAETCSTFDDVHHAIMACPPGINFIITASSATERRAAIYERKNNAIEFRTLDDKWVAACNVAQGQTTGKTALDKRLLQTTIVTREDLIEVLRQNDVLAGSNIYSVVFDYSNNRFFLASGSAPAASDTYRSFTLF